MMQGGSVPLDRGPPRGPHLRAEFAAALRHSKRVRLLRLAIPVFAIGIVAVMIGRSYIGHLALRDAEFSFDQVEFDGAKNAMTRPKLSGFRPDGSRYDVSAERASQDLSKPHVVELKRLDSRIQSADRSFTRVTGEAGTYDSRAETLDFVGRVTVRAESGLEADLRDASIRFRTGEVRTDRPAEVRSRQGTITSGSLTVLENGNRLIFEGGVQSVFVGAEAKSPPRSTVEGSE
jgi:lipopolysaccharide export system protein LptC